MSASEVGRRLKASELKPRTIVVIAPPGRDAHITMWVFLVDNDQVTFRAHAVPGVETWTVINFVRDDGELIDDQGRIVRVYEYLGEP